MLPESTQAGKRELESRSSSIKIWSGIPEPYSTAAPTLWARDKAGRRVRVPMLVAQKKGVPAGPIPAVAPEEVVADGTVLWTAWCPMTIQPGHTNRRIAERLDFCAEQEDPVVFVSPQTRHTPVMHFHGEQLHRARAAGIEPPLEEGPSQYGPFAVMPNTFPQMFKAGSQCWDQTMRWMQEAQRQIVRVEQGKRYVMSGFPGGRNGLEYGVEEINEPYGCVQWRQGHDGRPQIVQPSLPDDQCALRLNAMYVAAIKEQVDDQGIMSEIALYGVGDHLFVPPNTGLYHHYSGAWTELSVMQDDRQRKKSSAKIRRAEGWPMKHCSRSVIFQPKPGGKVKIRPINDAGSKRKPRKEYLVPRRRRDLLRHTLKGAQQRSALSELKRDLRDGLDTIMVPDVHRGFEHIEESYRALAELKHQQSSFYAVRRFLQRKGDPGDDSVNACVDKSKRAKCGYGSVSNFTRAVDILLSSGLPVDIVQDDFVSFYEQWPVPKTLQWMCMQMLSAEGMDVGVVADFGVEYYPTKLNRANFVVCIIVAARLRRALLTFDWTPWSQSVRLKAETFFALRHSLGASGDPFTMFPWFDDNSHGVLSFFRSTLQEQQYSTWTEFGLEWAKDKAAQCLYNCVSWTPVVGFDIRAAQRERALPAEKVTNYCKLIDTVIDDAGQHPHRLIPSEVTASLMGKLSHAVDAVPSLWDEFISLITLFHAQGFEMYNKVTREERRHLRSAQHKLKEENGVPFTPYTMRPGMDGAPVWEAYSDASLRKSTYFSAAGGWFRLWNSNWIFFFMYQWSAAEARQCDNIGELEMVAAEIAAVLQARVHQRLGGAPDQLHYLLQMGDNAAVFDYALNSMRGHRCGMRFLARRRSQFERRQHRLVSGKHVKRDWNAPADALANLDVEKFERLLRKQVPDAHLCQIEVPHKLGSLTDLNRWVADAGL